MRPADQIITKLPLQELFDENGLVEAVRQRNLFADDVRELLQNQPIRFVVASCGKRPVWVAEAERFSFWKSEVFPHLVNSTAGADLDAFPDGYCYFASEWLRPDGTFVVLLEMAH
jgi:hypothetical protein